MGDGRTRLAPLVEIGLAPGHRARPQANWARKFPRRRHPIDGRVAETCQSHHRRHAYQERSHGLDVVRRSGGRVPLHGLSPVRGMPTTLGRAEHSAPASFDEKSCVVVEPAECGELKTVPPSIQVKSALPCAALTNAETESQLVRPDEVSLQTGCGHSQPVRGQALSEGSVVRVLAQRRVCTQSTDVCCTEGIEMSATLSPRRPGEAIRGLARRQRTQRAGWNPATPICHSAKAYTSASSSKVWLLVLPTP